MLTETMYLMDRAEQYPPTDEMKENMALLLERVNALAEDLQMEFRVSSGYRPKEINDKLKGAAKKSWHTKCAAVDLVDFDCAIKKILYKDQGLLEKHELYMEHPKATPTWCHLQIFPPKSGKRVFIP